MNRIVLDQGLPATAVMILREGGWDAVHAREIQMHEATDIEILDYAARESRVLITLGSRLSSDSRFDGRYPPLGCSCPQQRLRAA
jgi:predicted nuclease of predicted toxin-antitoxin system